MHKIVTLIMIGFLFLACKNEPIRTDYLINGNAKGVYNGVRAYLKVKDERGREITKDTAIIFNEKFSFNGTVETPTLQYITVNSVNGSLPLILENSEINVEINTANIATSKISGSETQRDFEAFESRMKEIRNEITPTKIAYQRVMRSPNSSEKDSLSAVIAGFDKKLRDEPLLFINDNTGSYYSLLLID